MSGLLLLAVRPVLAQSGGLEARLNRLENEIQTLSRAVFKGERPASGSISNFSSTDQAATAAIEVRLSQIEMDMRSLTGRVEEMIFEINQVRERADKTIVDLETRVAELERRNAGGFAQGRADIPGMYYGGNQIAPHSGVQPGMTQPYAPMTGQQAPAAVAPPPGQLGSLSVGSEGYSIVSNPNDPSAVYEQAFSLVREQRFDEAEVAFKSFLENYPGHVLTQNAKYWLAETYYVRAQYETAARLFAEAYQQDPKGSKAPDNLLKMGMSLAGMGSVKDACVALSQIQKEFPNGAGPVLSRAEQEMERLKCQ